MYSIRSSLLSADQSLMTSNPIEKLIHQTLSMYDQGEDVSNSPWIQSGEGLHHKDVYYADNKEQALLARQQAIISLYQSIKDQGYTGSTILAWFDDDGFAHLYDGFTRISIMNYLGLDQCVNVEVSWTGLDGSVGKDFPLVETLLNESPDGKRLYQPVDDQRVAGWKVDRADSLQRLKYIKENIIGETVLDIGCSEGYFSRELAKAGFRITAVDKSKGLVAAARYLSAINGLDISYQVSEWKEAIDNSQQVDNVLFLSVLHNDMKNIGVEEGLKKLQAFRGKAKRVFFEVPNNTGEAQWMKDGFPKFDFHVSGDILEKSMEMSIEQRWPGVRSIFLMGSDGHKVSEPEWNVDNWLKARGVHYGPLFEILKSRKFHNIMEIGTWNGSSAVGMIKTAALRVPEDQIHYYGFDLFEEATPELLAEEFSPRYALLIKDTEAKIKQQTKAEVSLFKGDTKKTLPAVIDRLPKMDFIYVDGGHTVETIRNDWGYVSKLMKPDTVVVFDDYCDEMSFIGPKFLIGELDKSKYTVQVTPEADYYPRAFGRFKSQLLVVQMKLSKPVTIARKTDHLRLHILGVPHTKTNKDHFICPFTELAYGMCQMMTKLGHEVYHYGAEGSDVPCTEDIEVLSDSVQREAYGDFDWKKHYWNYHGGDLAYTTFAKNAIEEINRRKDSRDLLLTVSGKHHKGIADAVGLTTIEYAIGYEGVFSSHRVFASYAWMHYIYGLFGSKIDPKKLQNGSINGQWYDAVIPHYFNPDDFEFREKKEDYFLYIGRLIPRKAPHIAAQTCERLGAKLVVAGQGDLKSCDLDKPYVEYVGTVGVEERSELMGKAKAVFVPTMYIEPFGMTVVEALMCGTPVITTDWGAFTETVRHGEVGYRCRTMDDFVWAAENIGGIKPADCRKYAEGNYSLDRVSKMYAEYFSKIQDLHGGGWYQEHPERKELDWLRKY